MNERAGIIPHDIRDSNGFAGHGIGYGNPVRIEYFSGFQMDCP